MCRPVRCTTCRKTTWAGCGQHVAAVEARVPAGQWCPGGHTEAEITAAKAARGGGLLDRLRRRG